MAEKEPTIACPKKLVDIVLEDTRRLSDWAHRLIREYSGQEYDWAWGNYHSTVTVLCEYYVSTLGLFHYLEEITGSREPQLLDDGTKYFILSNLDLSLISDFMNTMKFCEQELTIVHNISLQLH